MAAWGRSTCIGLLTINDRNEGWRRASRDQCESSLYFISEFQIEERQKGTL